MPNRFRVHFRNSLLRENDTRCFLTNAVRHPIGIVTEIAQSIEITVGSRPCNSHPSIHHDHLPGHERPRLGRQEGGNPANILGLANPA